ncbi:MAG: hypothetical protein RIR00_1056 [Pseudomonadota bacterium]|jgi:uncharacterized protein (DUF1330 family)
MGVRIIGLIRLKDPAAFEQYRQRVGATVALYQGVIAARSSIDKTYWNEPDGAGYSAFVELEFPSAAAADQWAASPEYQAIVPLRATAMDLTLVRLGEG